MKQFEDGVPFDPGYSRYYVYFPDTMELFQAEMSQLKSPHQKKFKLSTSEAAIKTLINECAAFYLGCVLWGAFIYHRFKNNPKNISGNLTEQFTEEELKNNDNSIEINYMLKFIENLDKDYKYFLKKPFKVDDGIINIFNVYKEFSELNNNFITLKLTNEIKLPEAVKHFEAMDTEKLDALYEKIMGIIDSGSLQKMLELGFYNQ